MGFSAKSNFHLNRPMSQNIVCGLYEAPDCVYYDDSLTRYRSIVFYSVCPESTRH